MIEVIMIENERSFNVFIGSKSVGKVTSYKEPEDEKDSESFCALRRVEYGTFEEVGWYSSLKKAGIAIIEYAYGVSMIDTITRKKA